MEVYYKGEKVNGATNDQVIDNLIRLYEWEEVFDVSMLLNNTEIRGMSLLNQRQYFYFIIGVIGGIASKKGINVMEQIKQFY